MAVDICYDTNHRLTVTGLACDCGLTHQKPAQDIYVGAGILSELPAYIKQRGMGTRCVLVADENTYRAAGREAEALLLAAGYAVTLCLIRRDGAMEPDERACGELLLSIREDTAFLVAVGSGSITDTARVCAARCRLPFVSVGTAPSMDGYTSVVAPLILRGVKIHRQGPCPDIILCDLDILRQAPLDMVISGVGDVLGKYIAVADWRIGAEINDEIYCPVCGDIVLDAVAKLMNNIKGIRARTEEGIRALIEALLLAGLTVLMVGHTRAVASAEHNIAHYWEMQMLARRQTPPMHGASVGVATRLLWPLFKRFAAQGLPDSMDDDALLRGRITPTQREQWMLRAYGEEAARSIMADNPGDFLTDAEHFRRIQRARERFPRIRAIIDDMPSEQTLTDAMQALGAPMTPADLGLDDELVSLSMHCAKDYRTRYTLLKLLDECGLLNDYLKDYVI